MLVGRGWTLSHPEFPNPTAPLSRWLTRTEYWDRAGGERNITFKAFRDFRRAKIAYNGLKTGSFHLFMHPKRSRYHSVKSIFDPALTLFGLQKAHFFFKAFWNCGAS